MSFTVTMDGNPVGGKTPTMGIRQREIGEEPNNPDDPNSPSRLEMINLMGGGQQRFPFAPNAPLLSRRIDERLIRRG